MIRTLALAGGLAGALGLSQFPEFSQQYLQRLSGALDELRGVVVAFDTTATAAGLTREEALSQVRGNAVTDELRETMATSIRRYERLSQDYDRLAQAGPLERLAQPWRFRDTTLVQRTADDFSPAVPVTPAGVVCAGLGFAAGWGLVAGLLYGLRRVIFGRQFA
ncbi:DUF2937 family protein [Tranquillimonas alkanivorans]|uniref:DUF2937 family protein n=1 Tax=Tranquillimonas alkanivorans TaxID=441119 RepID=A0A1I5N7X8_9RHOB|nr:DUF2937 family protein [Tranquillimonas alkanivorans]SFP17416.1 Protein of unknown function [Tranquillimonas alkanivorans]